MKKVNLFIDTISYSQSQNGVFALILKEVDGVRELPIVIGPFEAQSISIAMERDISIPRPLTHDLMSTILSTFDIEIVEILIYEYKDNLFYSKIVLLQDDETVEIECRTSDAVALAIRKDAPIYTLDSILNQTSLLMDEEEDFNLDEDEFETDELEEEIHKKLQNFFEPEENEQEKQEGTVSIDINNLVEEIVSSDPLEQLSVAELKEELKVAIENDDFEMAAKIRDILKNLNS
jgi:bifunctional DNase/RNase